MAQCLPLLNAFLGAPLWKITAYSSSFSRKRFPYKIVRFHIVCAPNIVISRKTHVNYFYSFVSAAATKTRPMHYRVILFAYVLALHFCGKYVIFWLSYFTFFVVERYVYCLNFYANETILLLDHGTVLRIPWCQILMLKLIFCKT